MKAIILAAGAGRRLGLPGPKSLIDITGTSILRRQIRSFRSAGAEDFVIVVGFEHEQVREHLRDEPGPLTFIVNDRYAETNTIYSLYLAKSYLDRACFYANADVLFDSRLPQRLAAAGGNAFAIQTGRCAEEEVKVVVNEGRIAEIGKRLEPTRCLGEFVGVARFDAPFARAMATTLADLVEREGIVSDYFERAVNDLCAQHELKPVDITDLPCREIDFPEDLEAARKAIGPALIG